MLDRFLGKKESPYADLQVHSYYSDGHVSPTRLLAEAQRTGLQALAVTDHDNLEGTRAALKAAPRFTVEVIPALELTTWWETPQGSGEIDILGYFVDADDAALNALTVRAMADITERIAETCSRLSAAGYPTTIDDIRAVNPHYPAKAVSIWTLVDKHEFSWEEAKKLFYRHFSQVKPCSLTTEAAIEAIRGAGGVSVLAHPGRVKQFGDTLDREQLGWLVAAGLRGIEVFYPTHTGPTVEHFQTLAAHFDLLTTGGSDEHAYQGRFGVIGSQPVTREMVETLRSSARVEAESLSR